MTHEATTVNEGPPAGGDPLPPGCVTIEVHVAELKQLFNSMDPSPFRERDLDPNAEEFIVEWAREAPRDARLGLLVHLDRDPGPSQEPAALRDAVHEFFRLRSQVTMRRLRELLRRGRRFLAIGLLALAVATIVGDLVASGEGRGRGAELLRESLLIGGWVAMWRPLEVFLYDWWPILAEARLYDRLSAMPVRIEYCRESKPQAWRTDWPAVPAARHDPQAGSSRQPL